MLLDIIKKLNWVDVFVIIALMRIGYVAFETGFTIELFKLLGTLFAIYLSMHYFTVVSDTLIRRQATTEKIPLQFTDFVSFLVLTLAGFNNTFFVLFLKNLGWSQNQILIFNSLLSLVFLPISIWVIKQIAKSRSEVNVSRGSQITGIFSILLGGLAGILNFYYVFFIMLGKFIGGLMANSGRSGLLTTKLKELPEESAAVDTIFSPLATAIGAIIGGLIISPLGYPLTFVFSGILIFGGGLIASLRNKKN